MRRLLLLSALFITTFSFAQGPFFQWVALNEDSKGREVIESDLGNVYSVGKRGNGDTQDCFIRKFDEDGNLLWEVFVGDLAFGIDGAAEGWYAAIDSEESIYVTGTFEGTIDMDAGDNEVNVTAQGGEDIFMVKYNADGNYVWNKVIGGDSSEDVTGLDMNSQGELILAGRYLGTVDFDPGVGEFFSTADGSSGFILKLTDNGDFVDFVDLEEDTSEGGISVQSIALDSGDNIFVVGRFSGEADFDFDDSSESILTNTNPGAVSDGFVLKLTDDFEFVWVRGLLSSNFFNYGIDTAPDQGLLITGIFNLDLELLNGTETETLFESDVFQSNYYVMKFDTFGDVEWLDVFFNDAPSTSVLPSGLATDIFGDVYITGALDGPHDLDPSDEVSGLNSSGVDAVVFVHKLNGSDGSFGYAFKAEGSDIILGGDIFIGSTGNLYINGQFPFSSGNVDFDPVGQTPSFSHQNDDAFLWKLRECFPLTSEIDVTECDEYVSPSGNEIYNESGTYMDTVSSFTGCDSIITINLTILESTSSSIEESACVSYTWPLSGETYDQSGQYETIVPNSAGCDSLITLNLEINEEFEISETESACESFIWEVNGETLLESGTYTENLVSTQGCDSARTLELTIFESSASAIEVFECDEYESPSGNILTETGIFEDVIPNEAGCDSVITIDLEVGLSSGSFIEEEACFTYTSPSGQEYTESGEYTEFFVNTAGCDSILELDITINEVNVGITNIDNSLSADEDGADYQWLDCDEGFQPISGETGQSFFPMENGSYAVEVTNELCSDTSDCLSILDLSVVSNSLGQEIGLYPNPSNGEVFLGLEEEIAQAQVRIFSITGKLIESYQGYLSNGFALPLDEYTAGIYFVEITSLDEKVVLKVTKM